jgi:hypothetical protein
MPTSTSYDSLLNLTRNVARAHCRKIFDPAVILAVFQFLRTNAPARRVYLAAIGGGTGMERGSHQKQIVNPMIARTVAAELAAERTGEEVDVDDEFIESYSVLAVR